MARRRIGAHHVDVAPACAIPEMCALPARKHDRKRLVIASAVSVLELHAVHGTSPDTSPDSATRIYDAAARSAAEVKRQDGGIGARAGSPRPKRRLPMLLPTTARWVGKIGAPSGPS